MNKGSSRSGEELSFFVCLCVLVFVCVFVFAFVFVFVFVFVCVCVFVFVFVCVFSFHKGSVLCSQGAYGWTANGTLLCSLFTRCVWANNAGNAFVYINSGSMNEGSILSGQDLSFFGMKKGSDVKQCRILCCRCEALRGTPSNCFVYFHI